MAEKDIPAVAALLTDAFAAPGYSALQRAIVRAETAAGLAERIGASLLLVAEREGAVVGSVEAFTPDFLRGKQLRFWSESLPLESYVSALATAPSARRSGVGRTLMSRVEAIVWEAGESVLSLQVDELNGPALQLYRGLGYEVVGRERASTTPSRYGLVSKLLLGGVRERTLLVLQKPRPPAAAEVAEPEVPRGLGVVGRLLYGVRRRLKALR